MKIAMVSEHASPLANLGSVDAGGQNVHVAALAAAMSSFGHSVTVYTRRDDPHLPEVVRAPAGFTVRHVDAGPPAPIPKDAIYPFIGEFSGCLREAWRFDRPDIVHSHFWMSGLAAIAAAETFDLPTAHTYHALGSEKLRHQGAADTSPATRIAAEAHIAETASCIVATSQAELAELQRMNARPRSTRVIPCGVDVDRFNPLGRREQKNSNVFRVVTVSRLVPRKGIDTTIECLQSLENAELIVAGGGEHGRLVDDPETQRLRSIAVDCGVSEKVFFRGPIQRTRVAHLLRSADVVVCTPWYEPFGMVALEAMASGVPVVASDVGGLRDTIVDGVTGFHVPPRSPSRLAAALRTLRRSPNLRSAFGSAGRRRAADYYGWPSIATETLNLYRLLIADEDRERLAMAR